MNIQTKLLEDYVNFVDTTKKQNKYFKIISIFLWLFYLWFNFLFYLNIKQRIIIRTTIRIFILIFMFQCYYKVVFVRL